MPFAQREAGIFRYPSSQIRKLAWRLPLLLWRTGLAPLFWALPMVVMTTRGRKTGAPRRVMTDYTAIDGKTYVVPGWGRRNQWYRNMQADPHITVQRSGQTYAARAVRVTDQGELADIFCRVPRGNPMWKRFLRSWEIEDELQDFLAKSDRFVVVRLDRSEGPLPLPPLRVDLWWVWPSVVLAGTLAGRRRRG